MKCIYLNELLLFAAYVKKNHFYFVFQYLSDNSLETYGVRSLVNAVQQFDSLTTLDLSGMLSIKSLKIASFSQSSRARRFG